MELLTTKIIALTLLGALSLFFGLLPLRLRKTLARGNNTKRERVVSCLLCFGAGVLLATVFTHMLPETREGFQAAAQSGLLSEAAASYPLAEVVTCAGFFLIYFIEEFVHKIFLHRKSQHGRKLTKLAAAIEEDPSPLPNNNNNNNTNNNNNNNLVNNEQAPSRCSVYSIEGVRTPLAPPSGRGAYDEGVGGVDNPVFAGDLDAAGWSPALRHAILEHTQPLPGRSAVCPSSTPLPPPPPPPQQEGHGHSHLSISKLSSKGLAANLRSLLVVLALSFHSIFEGLAVGLQEREVDVWYLLAAISAHKFVIAFCVGLELLAGGTAAGVMVVYMVVFALVSPLGVAVGILVTENLGGAEGGLGHLASVTVLQGLAAGTILYVTFFEVLERERSRPGGRLLRFFFVLFGFAAMAAMEAVGGHSHGGHGHSHGGHAHGHAHDQLLKTTSSTTEDPHFHDHHHGHDHDHHHHDHDHDHGHGHAHIH